MKKFLKYAAAALLLLGAATGIFFGLHEYAVYEETPPAVRLADALLRDVLADAPYGAGYFGAPETDAAARARLRAALLPFWARAGETQISAGSVFTTNRYKPTLSEQPYWVRVACVRRVDGVSRTLVLYYRPSEGCFAPRAEVDGVPLNF